MCILCIIMNLVGYMDKLRLLNDPSVNSVSFWVPLSLPRERGLDILKLIYIMYQSLVQFRSIIWSFITL